jgi:hypothetical protein
VTHPRGTSLDPTTAGRPAISHPPMLVGWLTHLVHLHGHDEAVAVCVECSLVAARRCGLCSGVLGGMPARAAATWRAHCQEEEQTFCFPPPISRFTASQLYYVSILGGKAARRQCKAC